MTNYTAGVNTEEVRVLKNHLAVARSEISNLRQQLATLKHTYRKDYDGIRQLLDNWRCPSCKNNRQLVQEIPGTSSQHHIPKCDLPLQYIGTICTDFPEKRGTPRQPGICADMVAKLTLQNNVFTNPEHAMDGLQEYSHMWILFHFHKNDSTHTRAKVAPPRLNGLRTGVFATRSPHRPCPIGLSLVKIDRIMENTIYFSGVDMVDQTPVLDIKPYIPQYDNPSSSLLTGNSFHDTITEPITNLSMPVTRIADRIVNINGVNLEDSLVQDSHVDIENLNGRVLDGQENGRNEAVLGASFSQNVTSNLEELYHENRSASRIGEREAPDGEEEESPRQLQGAASNLAVTTTTERQIRTPAWIDQPPVSSLTVNFSIRSLNQLHQLGTEGEQKKATIRNVLREDPRSVYLRERSEEAIANYIFRIAELYVSCRFDDIAHTVTVLQVFLDSVAAPDE